MSNGTPEVLIVGAGPVGLFAGLALARRGVGIKIVDTGVWATTHSYALALHPQSMQLMREAGLAGRILEGAYPVHAIGLYDGRNRRAELRLGVPDDAAAGLVVVRQDALEGALEAALHEAGVGVEWRHEVSALSQDRDLVGATIDRYERESRGYVVQHSEWVVTNSKSIDVPFVIGADGYNSRVRRALKIEFPEVAPAQYFAVFEFKSDFSLNHEMRVVLADGTTNVLWPLPEGYCRWSFELPGYQDEQTERGKQYRPTRRIKDRRLAAGADESPVLEDSNLRHLLNERAPWFDGSIEDMTWRTVVRFERRLAERFGEGRMWLAGDAAHLTGPVGVQSMNLGLFEAHDLAESIAGIQKRGGSLHDFVGYNEKWSAEWRTLEGVHGAGLHAGTGADSWIREHAAQLTTCIPGHGPEFRALAAQLGLSPVGGA